jgi:hypothetical protein
MNIRMLPVLAMLFSFFLTEKAFGQQAQNDNGSLHASIDQNVSDFYIAIGQESRLYNGTEYHPYPPTIKGTPYFPLDAQTWATGEVTYDGILYKGVPMMYDIVKDEVVALLYNHFSMYTLIDERVQDFSFSGHHFVRINADSLINDKSGISTGFYDQIYSGKIELLAKWSKTIQETTSNSTTLESYFADTHDYYLRKGNTWYKVNSQSAFLNALKDRKATLQQYLKSNKMKFKQNPELAMIALATYYDKP